MLTVKQIINKPVDSNCFIVHSQISDSCLIIDPGTKDNFDVHNYILKEKLVPEYIILTHQHFDHIWGVNDLIDKYKNVKLICSRYCSEMIVDSKKNCSLFFDQVGFTLPPAHIITQDTGNQIKWNNITIKFFDTPGHSTASICILIGNYLFTGDTLIKDTKTVVKLPYSSKEDLTQSILLFENLKGNNYHVYSGHGESFGLDNYILNKIL